MNSAVITVVLNRCRIFYSILFACFLGHLLSCKMNRNIMAKYKSNFPAKQTQPIQVLFEKFERLTDGLVLNRNEFSIFSLSSANFGTFRIRVWIPIWIWIWWHLSSEENSNQQLEWMSGLKLYASDRRRVYSSHEGRTTDQDESTEMQLKEFTQPVHQCW